MIRPKFIDIHAHVNFSAFDADREKIVDRALKAGVWMINVGTQENTSREAAEMTRRFAEGVYAIVGLHPIHTNASFHDVQELGDGSRGFTSRGEVFDKEFYRKLIKEGGGKVVGIGECGLDYYGAPTKAEQKSQKEAFIAQIKLALELDLPLMLHVRNAYRDVLDILKPFKEKYGDKLRGNVHFFAGTVEEAKEFLNLGFYLSYTGVVTFAKQYEELVKATPMDRIMSETDCPYVSPAPERGKRNEPLFVTHVADKIAGIKGIDQIECRGHLVENAFRLFLAKTRLSGTL